MALSFLKAKENIASLFLKIESIAFLNYNLLLLTTVAFILGEPN